MSIDKKAPVFSFPELTYQGRQQIEANWEVFSKNIISQCFEDILDPERSTTGRKKASYRLIIRLKEEWEDLKPGITIKILEDLKSRFEIIKPDWYQYYRTEIADLSRFEFDKHIIDQGHSDYMSLLTRQIVELKEQILKHLESDLQRRCKEYLNDLGNPLASELDFLQKEIRLCNLVIYQCQSSNDAHHHGQPSIIEYERINWVNKLRIAEGLKDVFLKNDHLKPVEVNRQLESVDDSFTIKFNQALNICITLFKSFDMSITNGDCTQKSLLEAIIWYAEITSGLNKNEVKKKICKSITFNAPEKLVKGTRLISTFKKIGMRTSENIFLQGDMLVISKK